MWATKGFLTQCYELHKLGLNLRIEMGKRVARGFADVGFEEYCVLPGRKIISLLNGKVTPFPEEEEGFFFVVPTADEAAIEIDKLGADILRIDCIETREWSVVWRTTEAKERSSLGASIEEALLAALSEVFQSSTGKRSLKVING